jgi:A/G-specific adenine glycosylase
MSPRKPALPVPAGFPPNKVREFRSRLLRWFSSNARVFPWRKPHATVYQKIVAEVLLQRTRAEVVNEFLPRFLKRYSCWNTLSASSEKELGVVLRPLGLWRRRATSLKQLASEMAARKGRFPTTRIEIESLPGVGQYIASAVMLFCGDVAEPLLDVNMARVLERFFGPRKLADIRYDPYLQNLARYVISGSKSVMLNWAILDLAAGVCTVRNPSCDSCPLSSRCPYHRRTLDYRLPTQPRRNSVIPPSRRV